MGEQPEEDNKERVAKVIAATGLASRREAERLVEDGRVEVNGEVVWHPAHMVDPAVDNVKVDGKPLPEPPPKVYYLLYKPRGYITGRDDPAGRKSVLELAEDLPHRVEPVGRLDFNTEGALILTNDGELANRLTHPSSEVPKRYAVKVWKTPGDKKLDRLRRGVQLDDGRTAPCKIRPLESTDADNTWLEVTVTEGRNRLVRRMFDAIGHPVSKLRRESFATVSIRGMERGQLRPLTGEEIARLQEIGQGKAPAEAGKGFRYKEGFARPKERPNRPLSRKKSSRRGTSSRGGAAGPSGGSRGGGSRGGGSRGGGSRGGGSRGGGSRGGGSRGGGSRGGGSRGGGEG
ncbi:MAG: rRNA pseudouridine synthase [Alphaproteobacteria bacterium]|nr:rRNA pseudouridine synthase [Alphaproteobacteria bacterium]